MAWTEITRPKYQRDGLRYASDTTDEEWTLIEPHIPPPASCVGRHGKLIPWRQEELTPFQHQRRLE